MTKTNLPLWPDPTSMPEPRLLVTTYNWQYCNCGRLMVPEHETCWFCMSSTTKDNLVAEHRERMLPLYLAKIKGRVAVDKDGHQTIKRGRRPTGFVLERRNGAKVVYPGCELEVPSIWTNVRIYPYPNWRSKCGLKPSYLPNECKVVSPGWIPGEKNKVKEETNNE